MAPAPSAAGYPRPSLRDDPTSRGGATAPADLGCPRCGGRRMVVLSTIDDSAVIARILTHLGLSLNASRGKGEGAGQGLILRRSVNFPGLSFLRPTCFADAYGNPFEF